MDLQLKGKRAFISGSSSGLGAATAVELAAEGVSIAVHGRDRERAEETAKQVRALGVDALVTLGDLTSDEDAFRIADETLAHFGGVDILVNNAGSVLRKDNPAWSDLALTEWLDSFNLNVGAAVRMCLKFTPGMVERGWGRIINISSVAGKHRRGRIIDYGVAKAGLDNLTVNLSKQLGPKGVTVNSVSPGAIVTPAVEEWLITIRAQRNWPNDLADNERRYAQEMMGQSIPRLGRPREIAAAVTWLASPLSGYTNGANLDVDGGAGI